MRNLFFEHSLAHFLDGSKRRKVVHNERSKTHSICDWAIKTILRDKANFDVLEGFFSALLKEDIKVVQLLESESNQDTPRQKFNRVDIMVQGSNQKHMIIEIQNEHEADFLERLLFGTERIGLQVYTFFFLALKGRQHTSPGQRPG